VSTDNTFFIIASGTHVPMKNDEYGKVLDAKIFSRYRVFAHDCDDASNLIYLGRTEAETPVYVNKMFYDADLRIVVGDIEPHHFAGYSGGVKSASIGVCGRETINTNHAWLIDERSAVGRYADNPLRQDIESIGRMIKVDLSLNAVLNAQKEIVDVFFGRPLDVMREGIHLVDEISRIPIHKKFTLVIASAGGYPKDINLYQAQKAMTHASLFCEDGGKIVMAAECREGAGSTGYLNFMQGVRTAREIENKFKDQGFSVGPHKAFQIARIIEKHPVYLYSSMPDDLVRSLLLTPIDLRGSNLAQLINEIPDHEEILILPHATACIPKLLTEV
jgi:nickel-dependent lactate racemase